MTILYTHTMLFKLTRLIGRVHCVEIVGARLAGARLHKSAEEALKELAAKLATEHDAQHAVERRVDHDQKVAHVERVHVGGLELNANVLEHEQAENARRQLTYEKDHNEADDHDSHVVAQRLVHAVVVAGVLGCHHRVAFTLYHATTSAGASHKATATVDGTCRVAGRYGQLRNGR